MDAEARYPPGTILHRNSSLYVIVSREQARIYINSHYPGYAQAARHHHDTELPGNFQEAFLPGSEVRQRLRQKAGENTRRIPFMVTDFPSTKYQEIKREAIQQYQDRLSAFKERLQQPNNPLLQQAETAIRMKLLELSSLVEFLGFLDIISKQ